MLNWLGDVAAGFTKLTIKWEMEKEKRSQTFGNSTSPAQQQPPTHLPNHTNTARLSNTNCGSASRDELPKHSLNPKRNQWKRDNVSSKKTCTKITHSQKFPPNDVIGESRRLGDHKEALVPCWVVSQVMAEQLVHVVKLAVPQRKVLQAPLAVLPGMVVLGIILENLNIQHTYTDTETYTCMQAHIDEIQQSALPAIPSYSTAKHILQLQGTPSVFVHELHSYGRSTGTNDAFKHPKHQP